MYKPSGSWTAVPTPFNESGTVDFAAFARIIDFHIEHGTSALLICGSAGEVTLLTAEERRDILRRTAAYAAEKIPAFFGAAFASTWETVEFARFAQQEGADGIVLTVPSYTLIPQTAALEYLDEVMASVTLPTAVYNNPARNGVMLRPETIETLARRHEHFIADKEAVPSHEQIAEVKRRLGDRLAVLVCDHPQYSLIPSALALGAQGAANISGNVIPEVMAEMAAPWKSMEQVHRTRELYLQYMPLFREVYQLSNPIALKAAMNLIGLPAGKPRKPYPELHPEAQRRLKEVMMQLGVL